MKKTDQLFKLNNYASGFLIYQDQLENLKMKKL